jgi:hypothetical protein
MDLDTQDKKVGSFSSAAFGNVAVAVAVFLKNLKLFLLKFNIIYTFWIVLIC